MHNFLSLCEQFLLRRVRTCVSIITLCTLSVVSFGGIIFASNVSNFSFTVNAGALSVDIVDGSYVTVPSPAVVLSAVTFSFACQTGGSASTGTFGTASQQIYVKNPDAADGGWNVTLAATSGTTSFYDSAGTDVDFNDPTSSGCGDGADADSLK